MGLPAWFHTFCSPGADRRDVLSRALGDALVPFDIVKTGRFHHLQVRHGRPAIPQPGETVVLAHYDRVAGTPGANDNGASVLALVDSLRRPGRRPLRVVFTDGEELSSGDPPTGQGAYALAQHWGPVSGLFPVVLDMTGIGDTVILGHLGEQLIRRHRPQVDPTELDGYARVRLTARRWLASCGAGDTLEVNTPFSDDLGLFLAGLPAAQVSLLPRKEALAYRKLRAEAGEAALPPAWSAMHTANDTPDALWPESRRLVAQLLEKLEAFPVSLGRGGSQRPGTGRGGES